MQFLKMNQKIVPTKIGSLLIWGMAIMFCACVHAQNVLRLRVVSAEGQEIDSIAVNEPCLIEIIIPGSAAVQKKAIIKGIEAHHIIREQESMQMYILNGVTKHERTISYLVKFSQIGDLHLGPACITTSQGELISNELILHVQPAREPQQAAHIVFAELQIPQTSAFVGQAVPYILRFYYTDESVHRISLIPFSVPDAVVVPSGNTVRRGITQLKDKHCNYLEWSGIIYPKREGELIIPPIMFEYLEPQTQAALGNMQWMQFLHLMGPSLIARQQTTNNVTLEIKPLPPFDEPVCGVGVITDITARTSAVEMQQGNSIVYTVHMRGNAQMDDLHVSLLQVPEALKVYESSTRTEGKFPRFTKTYEYIVQGLESGSWVIPEQVYIFFNPEKERYETFVTPAQRIEVIARDEVPASNQKHDADQLQHEQRDDIENVVVALSSPVEMGPFLPFWVFIGGILLPIVWLLFGNFFKNGYRRVCAYRMKQHALKYARYTLQHAVDHNDAYSFRNAWHNLINALMRHDQVTIEESISYIRALGFSEHECAEWHRLWNHMPAAAFSESNQESLRILLQQAKRCIDLLQRYIKL